MALAPIHALWSVEPTTQEPLLLSHYFLELQCQDVTRRRGCFLSSLRSSVGVSAAAVVSARAVEISIV